MNNLKQNQTRQYSSDKDTVNVLLIDEDPITSKMIENSIMKIPNSDYLIHVSDKYREGVAQSISNEFDCIIINNDIFKDASSSLMKTLNDHELLGEIPVIIFTAFEDQLSIARALKAGASDYLIKDRINTATLKKSIDVVMNDVHMKAEISNKNDVIEKTNQHLIAKTNELEAFYHNVSHELKTPLTSIREFSSMLRDEISGELNKEQKEYVQICIESCDRASNYINSLLDFIRCDTGELKVNAHNTNIKAMINNVVKAAKKFTPSNVKIKYSIKTKKKSVQIDEEKISQVVTNFINNAVANSQNSLSINVTVRDASLKSDDFVIIVEDNGPGVHPNKLEHIFDRDYQAENNYMGDYQSMDVSLYVCQKIAELHNGELTVESSLGVGSKFSLVLPSNTPDGHTKKLSYLMPAT